MPLPLVSYDDTDSFVDTRFDVGKRYSVFYILGSLASACAGILAYGLMQLKGREGLNGWRCKLKPA
jgi:hypothetical protein